METFLWAWMNLAFCKFEASFCPSLRTVICMFASLQLPLFGIAEQPAFPTWAGLPLLLCKPAILSPARPSKPPRRLCKRETGIQ